MTKSVETSVTECTSCRFETQEPRIQPTVGALLTNNMYVQVSCLLARSCLPSALIELDLHTVGNRLAYTYQSYYSHPEKAAI